MRLREKLYITLFFLGFSQLSAQDSLLHKKRLRNILVTESALFSGSVIALNELWYKDYPRSSFHFFNDAGEWLQMDKAGHVCTSYYLGVQQINLFRWCGMKESRAVWVGGSLGFAYLSVIEVLDAYSSQWGFSATDVSANAAGALLAIGQEKLWKEQRIRIKYSFTASDYYKTRPQLLGSSLNERLLKDYNSQTYWASANIHSFLRKESRFPPWLNLALGYGANGMTGGKENPPFDEDGNANPYFPRYRQWYLSLDVDLTRIKTKSAFLRSLAEVFSVIKIPAPALELSDKRVGYYGLYF